MIRVLMVCLGNICRSPAAEGVLLAHLDRHGLADAVDVDSAGTGGYHEGEPADPRMRDAARQRGYDLRSTARAVRQRDFDDFDLILAMDRDNLENLEQLANHSRNGKARLAMLGEFTPGGAVPEVPDPYYGGGDGFERVLDLIESAMPALVAELKAQSSRGTTP